MNTIKDDLIAEIEKRVADKILEPTNAELLKKLIHQADNDNEAMSIATITGMRISSKLNEPISSNKRILSPGSWSGQANTKRGEHL